VTTALLRAVSARPNDLPPLWDGVRVEWGPWSTIQTSLRFHVPLRELACQKCGQVDQERHTARGRLIRDDNVEHLGFLVAHRCPGCGHDEVEDDEGKVWDLDPSDYTNEGSVDPDLEGKLF